MVQGARGDHLWPSEATEEAGFAWLISVQRTEQRFEETLMLPGWAERRVKCVGSRPGDVHVSQ
jgi:hypothetical protein